MQHLDMIALGVALLLFLGVCFVVVAVLIGKAILSRKPKPAAPLLYPIPPAERGTGKHVSLLDLFDDHTAAVEAEKRRKRLIDRVNALVVDDPKA